MDVHGSSLIGSPNVVREWAMFFGQAIFVLGPLQISLSYKLEAEDSTLVQLTGTQATMRITRLHIENFRSIRNLDIELGDTTVFIGPNNAGKTAILDAVRIVLTRRWGQRGTGFTEHDVHRPDQGGDPRTLPPVTITLVIEEPRAGAWDSDMVAALEDILAVLAGVIFLCYASHARGARRRRPSILLGNSSMPLDGRCQNGGERRT